MNRLQVQPLTEALVEVRADPRLAAMIAKYQRHIEDNWVKVNSGRTSPLINGRLANLLGVRVNDQGWARLTVDFIDYRVLVARRLIPDLADLVRPLAVSGLTVVNGRHVILGRRSLEVTQYPGWWEAVPSGGLEESRLRPDHGLDYQAQLLLEFEEETGLPARLVQRLTCLGLILDQTEQVYDLGGLMEVEATDLEEFTTRLKPTAEYQAWRLIRLAEASRWGDDLAGQVVPTTLALLELAGRRLAR